MMKAPLLDTMADEIKADIIMKACADVVDKIGQSAGLIVDNKDDFNAFFGEVVKQILSSYALILLTDYGDKALDGQIEQLAARLERAKKVYKNISKKKLKLNT